LERVAIRYDTIIGALKPLPFFPLPKTFLSLRYHLTLGMPKPGGIMGDPCHAITPRLIHPSLNVRGLHTIIWPMNTFKMFKPDLVRGFLAIESPSSKPSSWKRLRKILRGRNDFNSGGDFRI
jgi:hypothetical protein